MKKLFLCFIVLISTTCLAQSEDIKLRSDIRNVVDSIFIIELGVEYYKVEKDITFGLVLILDSSGIVRNCKYELLGDKMHKKVIRKVCKSIKGLNVVNYCKQTMKHGKYPDKITFLITSKFLREIYYDNGADLPLPVTD